MRVLRAVLVRWNPGARGRFVYLFIGISECPTCSATTVFVGCGNLFAVASHHNPRKELP